MARGRTALAKDDTADAIRWFDRACRLAPTDRTLTLALASACLSADPARAASLFAEVTRTEDIREAWLGLATSRLRQGDGAAAADALAQALRRHATREAQTTARIADAVVRAAKAPGWCGLSGTGDLAVHPTAGGPLETRLDGRAVHGSKLPAGWERAISLTVTAGSRHLIGSPIDIAAIRRVLGFVEGDAGGLRGWLWHPGDPDTDPELHIRPAQGRGALRIVASEPVDGLQWGGALARPRGFAITPAQLAGMHGPFHVTGRDGRDLLGSPIDPGAEQRATAAAAAMLAQLYPADGKPRRSGPIAAPCMPAEVVGPPPAVSRVRKRGVDVVIPVHGGHDDVLACLDSLLPTLPPGSRAVVVDDASPDPVLAEALDALAARGRIRLVRHTRNQGFPAAANTGIAACPGRDVVLLNSDTLVPPGWLQRLRDAVASAPDIGTATPFSNEASILSYPSLRDSNPAPDLAGTIALDRQAQRANAGVVVDIPVGVGFCLYLRRDCIDQVGLLRADVFAQGYGEENDFCLRARHLGWRSVAVPGVYVAHRGGASFGTAGRHLQLRNEALLNRLHPGYAALVQDFLARDPLAEARRRLDQQRWAATRRRGEGAVLLITHREGGGVEQQIAATAAAHRAAGLRPIVLRPAALPGARRGIAIDTIPVGDYPNLSFAAPDEIPALLRFLRQQRPQRLEVHHLLGHPPEIYRLIEQLGVPYTVHVHDYAWFCPRVSLVGGTRRYCGEPAVARCEACVADHGSFLDEDIGVQALRARSARFLAGAVRMEAPAADAAARIRRHFPDLLPVVVPHEDDAGIADPPPPSAPDGPVRVCVLGAIGLHKGYDVLLDCARDAAERGLRLEFVVVGHTTDDARLLATGRVFITGEYKRDEAVRLIAAQLATLGFLPSIWPETWSLGLTELWRAGLPVAAFDFGAPAERIRMTGRGCVLPLGLSAAGINNALIAAAGTPVHEVSRTAPRLPAAAAASGSPVPVTQPVRARPTYV